MKFLRLITSSLFIGFSVFTYIVIHELTHIRIFEIYQCENITFHLIYVMAFCDNSTSVQLATAIAEIVGYSLIPFLILITLMYMRMK